MIHFYLGAGKTEAFWLGARDVAEEGVWRWTRDNSLLSYTNWNSGEPNNAPDVDTLEEDCLALLADRSVWNDLPCSGDHKLICQRIDE